MKICILDLIGNGFYVPRKKKVPFNPLNRAICLYRFHEGHKTGQNSKERQLELLSIYQKYNPAKANLFKILMNEERKKSPSPYFLQKIFAIAMNKPLSYGHYLKILNYSKYRHYSARDINTLVCML